MQLSFFVLVSAMAVLVMSETYKYNVEMSCGGCSGAVERTLKEVEGIKYTISLEEQSVTIESDLTRDAVTEALKKCGKDVSDWVEPEEEKPTCCGHHH